MIGDFSLVCDGEQLMGTERLPEGGAANGLSVVLLHGAGIGSRERLLPVLDAFAGHGCRALALDFSGHGESSGVQRELTLERRFTQAAALIEERVPADGRLGLVGFSMSGQTVADLLGLYGPRVATVGLCAPAVYAPEAWTVPFGDGDGAFSEIIRTPDGWRKSAALDVFRSHPGHAVLAVPGTDDVIPPEVTAAVADALADGGRLERLTFPRAPHQLGMWLRDHEEDRRRFVAAVVGGAA
ncbi:alpha/beta hydrolase [Streptomyces sp. NPDC002004]